MLLIENGRITAVGTSIVSCAIGMLWLLTILWKKTHLPIFCRVAFRVLGFQPSKVAQVEEEAFNTLQQTEKDIIGMTISLPDYNSQCTNLNTTAKKAKELTSMLALEWLIQPQKRGNSSEEQVHTGLHLNDDQDNGYRMLEDRAAQHLSFQKSKTSGQALSGLSYGVQWRLIRQVYHDAKWYANGGCNKYKDLALEAVNNNSFTAFNIRSFQQAGCRKGS